VISHLIEAAMSSEASLPDGSDELYMAFVKDRSIAKAQSMVEKRAREQGYNVGPVYHGTKGRKFREFPFHVFNTEAQGKLSTDAKESIRGAFFSPSEKYAKGIALYHSSFGRDGKPVVGVFYLSDPEHMHRASQGFAEAEYVATHPSQIKLADPITYDDKNQVIPLSARFNPSSNDIRY
jgi:hypothetical protein